MLLSDTVFLAVGEQRFQKSNIFMFILRVHIKKKLQLYNERERLTITSSKIFLSSSWPCLSARCSVSEPSMFFIPAAQIAPGHWSRWRARFFKPNVAAQWRRVGSSLAWVSGDTRNKRLNRLYLHCHEIANYNLVLRITPRKLSRTSGSVRKPWLSLQWRHSFLFS